MSKRTLTVADVVEALYPIYLWEHRDPKVAQAEVAEALALLLRDQPDPLERRAAPADDALPLVDATLH